MREAAEALDDAAMVPGVLDLLVVAESGEQQKRAVLIGKILAVLERHVEELALLGRKLFLEALVDRAVRDRQRERIGRISVRVAAEHVARELVEQDHGGERRQRVGKERVRRKLALLGPELEEFLPDALIERFVPAPPFSAIEREPEFEDVAAPVRIQAAVAPTASPP